MRPSAQHGGECSWAEPASVAEVTASHAATGERPGTAGAGATYRIICSSEEALSDGELHVERRQGSVKAWYQRSSTPRRVTREAPPAAAVGRSVAGDGKVAPCSSFTVVVHDPAGSASLAEEAATEHAAGPASDGSSPGGSPASAGQLGEDVDEAGVVSWAANTLYDYLRGLREAEAPPNVDRWTSTLRGRSIPDVTCTGPSLPASADFLLARRTAGFVGAVSGASTLPRSRAPHVARSGRGALARCARCCTSATARWRSCSACWRRGPLSWRSGRARRRSRRSVSLSWRHASATWCSTWRRRSGPHTLQPLAQARWQVGEEKRHA